MWKIFYLKEVKKEFDVEDVMVQDCKTEKGIYLICVPFYKESYLGMTPRRNSTLERSLEELPVEPAKQ